MLPPSRHNFDTIWGHDPIKRLVRRMLETGRLPHALLLHGPDGVGKRSLAFAIAKMVLSSGLPVPESQLNAPKPPRFAWRMPEPDRSPDDDMFGESADFFGQQDDLFGGAAEQPAAPPPPPPVAKPQAEAAPAAEPAPEAKPKAKRARKPATKTAEVSEASGEETSVPVEVLENKADQEIGVLRTNNPTSDPRSPIPAPRSSTPDSRLPTPDTRSISLDPRIDRLVGKSYPIDYESPTLQGCPDLNIIEPIKSKSILVDQVRDLQELGWLPPIEGAYRVILIFGADAITAGAANSLLKLLEEPPSFLILILTSDHPHRMLETIRSRCASLPCHPLRREELKTHLVQDEKVDPELARVAATLSGGCPARALEAVQGGAKEKREEVFAARLDIDRRGLSALPPSTGRILSKAGSLGSASLLLMAFARDRMVRQLVPARPDLLVNEDLAAQIDEVPGDTPALWEEAERLHECLRMENHPLVAAAEPALEVALWPQ